MLEELVRLREQVGERKHITDTIYMTMREGIAGGILKGRTRIREEEVAELFQISRTPVRTALHRLEASGLIIFDPSAGFTVKEFNVRDCLDIVEASDMINKVATNLVVGRLSRSDLMILSKNVEKLGNATDWDTKYELNDEFHLLIISSTHNQVIIDSSNDLLFKQKIINRIIQPIMFSEEHSDIHASLLQSIAAGDQDAATEALNRHEEKSRVWVNQLLSKT